MKLSVPAKTFLVGEYLALSGGPSLVVTTQPRFELRVTEGASSQANPFHPESPAGRLWAMEEAKLKDVKFEFKDPSGGKGGLGASTAQFGLLYSYLYRFKIAAGWNWAELLEIYRKCAWRGEGHPPSGADLVAQLNGGITEFDGRLFEAKAHSWAFPDLVFTLVRTGFKVPTHEHLAQELSIPEERLRVLSVGARTSLLEENATHLAENIEAYGRALAQAGFLSSQTKELLEALRKANDELNLGLMAAKGCGAMGADVVLVLHKPSRAPQMRGWFELRGLEICGTEKDLERGLEIED